MAVDDGVRWLQPPALLICLPFRDPLKIRNKFKKKNSIIRDARLKAWVNWAQGLVTMGAPSHSRLGLNKIMIRIVSTVKYNFRLNSPKNWEFRSICQLATCDDRPPCIGHGLPSHTIIPHSVKRRQSIEPVMHIHLYRVIVSRSI
ncbi:hypothetical protein TNCV_1099751 [Trichonephila clavipes]|nr:hypothetical protein TNCV_1099751 [Trichonephila clavipes]